SLKTDTRLALRNCFHLLQPYKLRIFTAPVCHVEWVYSASAFSARRLLITSGAARAVRKRKNDVSIRRAGLTSCNTPNSPTECSQDGVKHDANIFIRECSR